MRTQQRRHTSDSQCVCPHACTCMPLQLKCLPSHTRTRACLPRHRAPLRLVVVIAVSLLFGCVFSFGVMLLKEYRRRRNALMRRTQWLQSREPTVELPALGMMVPRAHHDVRHRIRDAKTRKVGRAYSEWQSCLAHSSCCRRSRCLLTEGAIRSADAVDTPQPPPGD